MDDLSGHVHKILALLMHEFEVKTVVFTMEDIEAFKQEYGGELPTVVFEAKGTSVRVTLMSKSEVERRLQ